MQFTELNNAYEAAGIDLENDEQCVELGKAVSEKCVIVIRDSVSEQRLFDIQNLWGQPARAFGHLMVGERKLSGKHWRSLLVSLSHVSKAVSNVAGRSGMSRVSYEKNDRGKPTGIFTNGELDWHSDCQSSMDGQKVVGLMSLWGSEGSATTFLNSARAYAALNHEDRSMVDELYSVWEWDGGSMCHDLIPSQKEVIRYNMVPVAKMECPLRDTTAAGTVGIRFPSHCFSNFRGMGRDESLKVRAHLWDQIEKPEHVYRHDWKDGEIVFMDQSITLHARPTNVQEGDTRTMCRMISFLDNLYPEHGPATDYRVDGEYYDFDTFAEMMDEQRRAEFYKAVAA